ncbi:cyclin [Saccharomycopsis crataegensis]|uniref:Cyclin n=1 Tax=Saccharomycopsis crataegensis TaxID=43959 RepID=A0AAV5QEX7_9ASCO|nr:cyclin [Saccharomycopsis crataegensis]
MPFSETRDHRASILATNPQLIQMESKAHKHTFNEYSEDIFATIKEQERRFAPNLKAFRSQQELTIDLRMMMVDFLVDKCHRLGLPQTTLYLTVNLIDRYCSTRQVKRIHLELLGLTCLWIASKYSDNKHKVIQLSELIKFSNKQLSKKLFIEMESHVLDNLKWSVSAPTYDLFIDYFLNKSFFNSIPDSSCSIGYAKFSNDKHYYDFLKTGANFLCELSSMYANISLVYRPSKISQMALSVLHNCYYLEYYNKLLLPPASNKTEVQLFTLMMECFHHRFPKSFHVKYFAESNPKKRKHFQPTNNATNSNATLIYSSLINYLKQVGEGAKKASQESSTATSQIPTNESSTNSFESSFVGTVPPNSQGNDFNVRKDGTMYSSTSYSSPNSHSHKSKTRVLSSTISSMSSPYSIPSTTTPIASPMTSSFSPSPSSAMSSNTKISRNFKAHQYLNLPIDKCNSLSSTSSSSISIFSKNSSHSSSSSVNSPLSAIASPENSKDYPMSQKPHRSNTLHSFTSSSNSSRGMPSEGYGHSHFSQYHHQPAKSTTSKRVSQTLHHSKSYGGIGLNAAPSTFQPFPPITTVNPLMGQNNFRHVSLGVLPPLGQGNGTVHSQPPIPSLINLPPLFGIVDSKNRASNIMMNPSDNFGAGIGKSSSHRLYKSISKPDMMFSSGPAPVSHALPQRNPELFSKASYSSLSTVRSDGALRHGEESKKKKIKVNEDLELSEYPFS